LIIGGKSEQEGLITMKPLAIGLDSRRQSFWLGLF